MSASLIFWGNVLGSTLIASVWQSLIIFCGLRLLLWITRDNRAPIRYGLCLGALGVLGCWFIATFYARWQLQQDALAFALSTVTGGPAAGLSQPAALTAASGPSVFSPAGWSLGSLRLGMGFLYVSGLLWCGARVFRDVVRLRGIWKTRRIPFDDAWTRYLASLAGAWRITRTVGLFLSDKIDVPIMVGFLKPVIYLPISLVSQLSETQIEAILLHELAHIKRMDFLVNILETVVETLLFFNPLVGWISRRIRAERENSCDDLVISRTEPRIYASALLALEESRMRAGRFVLAAAGDKKLLFHRIKRVMEMRTKKMNVTQKLAAALILVLGFFSIAWLSPHAADHSHHQGMREDTVLPAAAPAFPATPVVAPPPAPAPPGVVPPAPPLPPMAPDPSRIGPSADSMPRPEAGTRTIKGGTAPHKGPVDTAVDFQVSGFSYALREARIREAQAGLRRYADSIRQYFQSKAWKDQQQDIQDQARSMVEKLKAEDWKQYGEAAKAMAEKMKAEFQSDAWKQQVAELEKKRPYMDSVLAGVRLNLAKLKLSVGGPKAMTFGYQVHTVDPARLLSMLRSDGLIDGGNRHQIRIDQGALFIDGKKQAADYGAKYQRIVGAHSHVVIKKNGGSLKSQVKTHD